jgi:hypothetical protein
MKYTIPAVLVVFALSASVALATEYWPPENPGWEVQAVGWEKPSVTFETPRDLAEYLLWKGLLPPEGSQDYTGASFLENLGEAAAFIATLQVDDPDTILFGGMREGEHLLDVIESDNTQESIWVWSTLKALTGESTYDANVTAAWQYIMNFPGYSEEGGTGPLGYYRVYNCAWGLWAVMGYEMAYGDMSHRDYGDSCAVYLMSYPLDIWTGVFPNNTLNGIVQSWAAGTLFRYGVHVDDASIRLAAAQMGGDVRVWVEDNPSRGLSRESWAMSGGATMWGVLNSYFKRRPDLAAEWLATYLPHLKLYDEEGPWNSAHNLWYSLGHLSAWEAVQESSRKMSHRLIAQALMTLDTEDDGGIPAQTDEPDTTDQSWVTNYLSFMGFTKLVPPADVSTSPSQYVVRAGGLLTAVVAVANNTDSTLACTGWIDVETPQGPFPGNPVVGPLEFSVEPWSVLSLPLTHLVPLAAPPGFYTYRASVAVAGETSDAGEYPFLILPAPRE